MRDKKQKYLSLIERARQNTNIKNTQISSGVMSVKKQ